MQFSEPLLTQAEYAARRNPLMAEISTLESELLIVMGRINSRAQELKDRMAEHHFADRWQAKIADWHKARLARMNRDYTDRIKALVGKVSELDKRWTSQQIKEPIQFIREIAVAIGLEETADRDGIITRLREIMNPKEVAPRQAAECVQSSHTSPRRTRIAVGKSDREGTRILSASKVWNSGRVRAFEIAPGVTVIPAGADEPEEIQAPQGGEELSTLDRLTLKSNLRVVRKVVERRGLNVDQYLATLWGEELHEVQEFLGMEAIAQ